MFKKFKCFNLILFLHFCIINSEVKIYEFFKDQFIEDFRAEKIVYNLLKKKHFKKDINYLMAPWTTLHFNKIFKKRPTIDDIPNIKLNGGFAVCSHDWFEELIPVLKRIGINVLFASGAENKIYDGIKVLTMPYYAVNGANPAKIKDVFYSFIGASTSGIRQEIFKLNHPKNTIIIKRDKFHFYVDPKTLKNHEKEYKNVLSRSRFSLCPRGNSAGSYRFWESLQAGAIPVLISDTYALPIGYNWNKCIIKIKAKDIHKIPEILQNISPEKEVFLRNNCIKAYALYSGDKFIRVIKRYYQILENKK